MGVKESWQSLHSPDDDRDVHLAGCAGVCEWVGVVLLSNPTQGHWSQSFVGHAHVNPMSIIEMSG